MELAFFIVIIVLFVAIAWRLWKPPAPMEKKDPQSLLLLQNQMNELTRMLDAKLGESAKAISDSTSKAFTQATESTRLIREITQELAKVGEGQRQVVSIADNLKNLQDILKNPKQRGVLGEYYLETVLKNVLPPNGYKMQYAFKDGSIVDAVVLTKDGIIPVDSKFSLENYNRILESADNIERERYENAFATDLKTRIDETAKYVKPEEGTLDFAFMFIPSEAVYYDLLINKVGAIKSNNVNLIEYAAGKKESDGRLPHHVPRLSPDGHAGVESFTHRGSRKKDRCARGRAWKTLTQLRRIYAQSGEKSDDNRFRLQRRRKRIRKDQ